MTVQGAIIIKENYIVYSGVIHTHSTGLVVFLFLSILNELGFTGNTTMRKREMDPRPWLRTYVPTRHGS